MINKYDWVTLQCYYCGAVKEKVLELEEWVTTPVDERRCTICCYACCDYLSCATCKQNYKDYIEGRRTL